MITRQLMNDIRVADMAFRKLAQAMSGLEGGTGAETGAPGSEQQEQAGASGGSSGNAPIYPLQNLPIANIVDRKYEIRVMMKNFSKVAVLVTEKINMLNKLLRSNGKDVKGFLDDPSVYDDKQWHELVSRSKRLVRDANEILMTTRDETPDVPEKEEPLPRRPDETSIYKRNKPDSGFTGQNMGGI